MRKLTEPGFNLKQDKWAGKAPAHESALRQVTGAARYVDDIPALANQCFAAVGLTTVASGKIAKLDLNQVKHAPGVIDVITVDDVPGHIDIAPVFDGDPILVDQHVKFHGQPLFAVLADSEENAFQALTNAQVEYEQTSPTLDIESAKKQQLFVRPPHTMQSGQPDAVLKAANHVVSGELSIGGQEHFYLEGQVSLAIPDEQDRIQIFTSSQHPSEVQKLVAEVLNIPFNKVLVDMRRMGGGFGGKETQAAQWACLAALLASRNRCAVKLRLPRRQDMIATGKRHPFYNRFRVAYNQQGVIQGADIEVNGNCGHSADLSDAIVDRAMFHSDNAYYLGDSRVIGHRCQTNQVSHTAFRGFGGPQGMLVAEQIIEKIARRTGRDPLDIRKSNLYGDAPRDTTHYGMTVENNLLPELIAKLENTSEYWQRRDEIKTFNRTSPLIKKGLALTPVKFGISFTAKHLNQAGALLHVYTDGSMQINHGGTEMGQGLHTKIQQIVANEFSVPLESVEVTSTRTDKVPNTSPTAASSGTDINGKAAQNACIEIKSRLARFYSHLTDQAEKEVEFINGKVVCGEHEISFNELVQKAYFERISLSTTGFYRTPKIHYNRDTGSGRPFFYFSFGAAVSEVTVDCLTGEYCVDRVDILHDVGNSINPAIDIGQIEGGFIQGMGWLTTEELIWDAQGKLLSNNPATYKIPSIGDTPPVFNVDLYDRPNAEDSIYHSKAVGEPPFMLAMSVWCALKDAISSISDYQLDADLPAPATAEKVLWAITQIQQDPSNKEAP